MKGTTILGIDIGTQGVKGALFHIDGTSLTESYIPSKLIQPEPGITEEDPEFQVDSVYRVIGNCLREAKADPNDVAAVALDGQMAGVIGVDSDGVAVTPYDSWLDTRCGPYIKSMAETAGEEVHEKSGNPPSFNHGPKLLWWRGERPDTFRKIARFVQPAGYAAMRLCGLSGREAFIDRSYLHFSSFADNRRGRWDPDLLERFDFPGDKLPRIVEPTEIVGRVTKAASTACGLPAGTPVAAGCGDTVASLLSAGAVRPGIVVDVAGTASVFAATVDDFRPDVKNGTLGVGYLGIPGMWYAYAYINGGGMNPEWFVDNITEEKEPERLRNRDDRAARLDDTLTLPLFVPHLAGRVSPGVPDLRGAFVGLNWNHGRDELYRAVLEGVALEYGLYRQILDGLFPALKIEEIRATGGGAKSGVWNLMKSGVLEAPVATLKRDRGAPAGAAMIAAVASGLADSLPAIGDAWVTISGGTVCPPERRDFYRERVRRYGALIDAMSAFCRDHPFEDRES